MNHVTQENHATARRDAVADTVSQLMAHPQTVHEAANLKHHLVNIMNDLYDRAVDEGRYLEIMEPSVPPEPETLPLVSHKYKLRAKYKNDTGDHE